MISFSKIWTIGSTEFANAVRSKAFLVGVLMVPAMGALGAVVPKLAGNEADRIERRVAVIDETNRIYPLLQLLTDQWNARQITKDGTVTGPRFHLEHVATPAADKVDDVRLRLSDRVRDHEIFAFVELPASLFTDELKIRYYTDTPTHQILPRFLEQGVGRLVIAERLRAANVDQRTLLAIVKELQLQRLQLVDRTEAGRATAAKSSDPARSFIAPLVLTFLMFMIVMSTASPLLNSVMEEKMTRVSEVMLGSVLPFELMAGKLLGVVLVSMVLSTVYLSGAYGLAVYKGYGDAVTMAQIAWFFVYLVMAILIYGSVFIAVGASATDLKDAQALMTPCMVLFMTPVFLWLPVFQAPGSTLAIVASLVPFATPMLMTLRMALSPAPTAWQIGLGFVLALGCTTLFVWAGGRIFRTGILMQGKSATFAEMWRWVRAG